MAYEKKIVAGPADRAMFQIQRNGSEHFTCTVPVDVGGSPVNVTLQADEMASGGLDPMTAGAMLDGVYAMALAKLGFVDAGEEPAPEPTPEP